MKANEILKAATMFARVKNLLERTRVHNVVLHPDGDYLFVFCKTNDYYTNSFCDIMENHDIDRVVPNGLRFAVNGFLYQGDVIATYDNKRTIQAKEFCFKVQIGDIIATGITASQLANYIDTHVEYSENYDDMVKQAYTPEEIDACKNITGIIFM